MIISFSATTQALLAGQKDTIRLWWPKNAIDVLVQKYEEMDIIKAWSSDPRIKGSRYIADIRIVERPFLQNTRDIKIFDEYSREGFQWMDELPDERISVVARHQFELSKHQLMSDFIIKLKEQAFDLTVVRFELVKIK